MIADGLLLAWLLLAWGAQAVLPWRLAGLETERRRAGALALLPLLLTGALAAFFYAVRHPDAAIVQSLYPLSASKVGRALTVLFYALAVSNLFLFLTWRRLEAAGWRIIAGFGLVFLLTATWAAELTRIGEGPESAAVPFLALVALRALAALGAAEALAPGPPRLAVAAGPSLLLYGFLLPARLAHALGAHGQWLTLATAALLLLGARWFPASLRRPALLGAALLAGLYLGEAARLSAGLGTLHP
ncbi:MAG TPA: hypothetical protein VFR03_15545 [Thermoanaerobaculia bacterium]|nr:hypothetical protein [Thermoanaerobaculia bacterium]